MSKPWTQPHQSVRTDLEYRQHKHGPNMDQATLTDPKCKLHKQSSQGVCHLRLRRAALYMNLHKCLAEMKPVRQLSNSWWQRQTGIINSRLVHSMKGLLQSLMWVNVKCFSFKQESWKWNTAYKNMRKTKTMLINNGTNLLYIHFYSNSTNQGRHTFLTIAYMVTRKESKYQVAFMSVQTLLLWLSHDRALKIPQTVILNQKQCLYQEVILWKF
jgi:hypothetical protein